MSSDIPYYDDYLSPSMKAHLLKLSRPTGVSGLTQVGEASGLETPEALAFLNELYACLKSPLANILKVRGRDRSFIDERVSALCEFNRHMGHDYASTDYQTILGLEDGEGRIVAGPKRADYVKKGGNPIAPLPPYLQGPHVTLFGPPDSAKMAVNAMNAFHRQLPGEPAVVGELLSEISHSAKWGADDEDSKTPLRADLVSAGVNLTQCFEGKVSATDSISGKRYELMKDHLSLPIKRFPGLALPCFFLFQNESAIPLHLYDFALHFFHNCDRPEALVFYVPKLENEEEARYIRLMMTEAERLILKKHSSYKTGTIRLMIVLENPRAIFRAHEIMDELYPYFAGASLGWHDYLASTARLFKEDSNYRIPVKADPNIVINYIKASHRLLADVVGPRGGIKVGGMYGILPLTGDIKSPSFQVTLKGYIKDVVTQFKRDLNGFWVAHPDFVRLGLALVEAWRLKLTGDSVPLQTLVNSLLEETYAREVMRFIEGPDIEGLDPDDPLYARSLIVADIKESTYIANNHPDEVRYNVFQCLQYLADWLAGNGCVALPAEIEKIPVRVMDDLATTERSRWEVWHEIYHGRFSLEDFLVIAHEELLFIRKDLSDAKKIVQVKWNEENAKWYGVAFKLMIRLMTDKKPCEFATELLMPFTVDSIRKSVDPWEDVAKIDGHKFSMDPYIEKFNTYFEALGSKDFAQKMASFVVPDFTTGAVLVQQFSKSDVVKAASFHGDIGEGKKTLDPKAQKEQAQVFDEKEAIKAQLKEMGSAYLDKFGFKFLVSAQGKSGQELLSILKGRINRSYDEELKSAKDALWEIALKRLPEKSEVLEDILKKHHVQSAQLCITTDRGLQTMGLGAATEKTWFEVASLSKSIASAFAIEYFTSRGIGLETKVNGLLSKTPSAFRIPGVGADQVSIAHLMNHQALNMHYVNGIPLKEIMPKAADLLGGNEKYGYPPVASIHAPGTVFQYSGAGYIVLEHLIEEMEGRSVQDLTRSFLNSLGMEDFSFEQKDLPGISYAQGFKDDGTPIPGGRLMFPAFAAGGMGTTKAIMHFLTHLTRAYHQMEGSGPISHDTARAMLHGSDKGCKEFMGSLMGLGIFITEASDNLFAVHQGANDGFRCLYVHCFAGPDQGKGLCVISNAELNGIGFNAEVTQEMLKLLHISGIDSQKFKSTFKTENLKAEEVVNIGYRDLVFRAFAKRLPEEIDPKGPLDPLSPYNLAVGAEVLSVTNELFARANNLLSPCLPIFDPELFGKQGKIMDSWESVRHNPLPQDEMVFELKKPSALEFISFSTKYHFGNHTPYVRLHGRVDRNSPWEEFLSKTPLDGHSLKRIRLGKKTATYSQIKVDMIPDGGLSRLGLYAELPAAQALSFNGASERYEEAIPTTLKPLSLPFVPDMDRAQKRIKKFKKGEEVDVASAFLGAQVLHASNEHYSPARQVISPYRPLNMFDGMESARSREAGHFDEVVIRLALPSKLHRLVFDFRYFVNNNPREIDVEGLVNGEWISLIPKTYVKSFAGSKKVFKLSPSKDVEQLRVRTFPDGGINRLQALTYWQE